MQNYQLTFSWRINGTIKLLHRYTPVMNSRVTTPGLPAADFKYADLVEQLIQKKNRTDHLNIDRITLLTLHSGLQLTYQIGGAARSVINCPAVTLSR